MLENNKLYEDLDEIDLQIIEYRQLHPGVRVPAMSRELNIPERTIYNHINKENVRAIITQYARDALDMISTVAPVAVSVLVSLLGSDDEKIKFAAAKELLKNLIPDSVQLTGNVTVNENKTAIIFTDEQKIELAKKLGLE